jgi:hypothetical protein
MKEKSNSFRGKVRTDGERSEKNFVSYLNLPKGIKQYQAEEDIRKIKLDILPYTVSDPNHPCKDVVNKIALEGDLWYRRPILMHTRVGGLGNSKILCPKSIGKKCPICDYQKKRFDEGAPKEETTPLYPQRRSLYVVIPDGEDDIYVWDMSNKMFQDMLIEELKDNPENEVFPDLEEGKTLEIRLKWKTIGEKGKPFPEATNITFLDREPYKASILDEVPDLDTILNVKSYDEIKNLFFELDEEPDGGGLKDVEDDEPKERKSRKVEKEPEVEEKTERRSRKADPEPDPEPEPKEGRRARRSESKEEPSDEKCPPENIKLGLTFGKDFEKHDDCDKCSAWDACYDANKKLKKG